jgi:sodium-dependent dicarboxylate transporter 2/3/5
MEPVQNLITRQATGLFLGPLLFVLLLLLPLPVDMPAPALRVAAVVCLMAVWWITEATPIAATALLPIVLFPLLGVMSTAETTVSYSNHLIYLFMGGFLIAVTIQKWQLHRRIAMHTIQLVGVSPNRMILGFMVATSFLSMWISNTATTMMMLPIGLAVVSQLNAIHQKQFERTEIPDQGKRFGLALMLGIAYSASIGGTATLIGTPPNAILAGMAEELYGLSISFTDWLLFGLPLSLVMLAATWFYLTRMAFPSKITVLPGAKQLISQELAQLGPVSREEKWVMTVFVSVSGAWIVRGLIDIPALEMLSDASIAMAGALLLFIIPSDFHKREFLLDWKTAATIPWEIIILFGGGFALAQGFNESGLSQWIAHQLSVLAGAPLIVLIGTITFTVIFLTEVTSNTATATLMIPVMGALAIAMEMHPYALMIPTAIAASYAFMLPVATPPNAIVFSSKYITIPQMAKAGFLLNIVAAILITLFVLFGLPLIWGLDLTGIPEALINRN